MPGNLDFVPSAQVLKMLLEGNLTIEWVQTLRKEAKDEKEAIALHEFALVSSVSHGKKDLADFLLNLNDYHQYINASFQTLQFMIVKRFKTLLGFAAYNGQFEMLKWLIKKRPDIHAKSISGQTVLHEVVFGSLGKHFLMPDYEGYNRNINQVFVPIDFFKKEVTAGCFLTSTRNQHVDILDYLLYSGAKEIGKENEYEGKTPLGYANTTAILVQYRHIIVMGGSIPIAPPRKRAPTWLNKMPTSSGREGYFDEEILRTWVFPEMKKYFDRRQFFLEKTKPRVQEKINTVFFSSCIGYDAKISDIVTDYLEIDDISPLKPSDKRNKPSCCFLQ